MTADPDPGPPSQTTPPTTLRRAITLPLLVFYGLGVTIGAGIYVLVGATAVQAGIHAPVSFLVAAFVMLFSASSFSELSGRFPQSAGEAAYVEAAFRLPSLTVLTGALLLVAGTISASAIAVGCAGYVALLVPLPLWLIITLTVLFSGLVAAWGVVESVKFAAVLTIVEVLGLVVVVIAGIWHQPEIILALPSVLPDPSDTPALASIGMASLLAFFAFIGFDGMVNIVEETENPARNMPLGIFITLMITTLLYFSVAAIAVLLLPLEDLGRSAAPISLLFESLTGMSPIAITLVAIAATLNGVIIQAILSARIIYGMAKVGRLPKGLAQLNARTRTPLLATALVTGCTLVFAVFFPIGILAERTSQVVLVVFILINLSLLRIKWRGDPAPDGIFIVPAIVPVIGLVTCIAMLVGPVLIG
ncbi:APC family permease [Roseobacter sp. GAI101]|uniref:APC family permease n=1 Tax=Roseobacter sp. (strain GAI101) TaxID=391589 RepID=UPI00018716A5|nr:amino acid permease [Roseobacter sp. GAI101]EEB82612.1 amino acid permease [Roseobacter sp. GAI101]